MTEWSIDVGWGVLIGIALAVLWDCWKHRTRKVRMSDDRSIYVLRRQWEHNR